MNKLMTVVAASVCAVSLSGSAVAAEDQSTENKETEELQEEEDNLFEAGVDVDLSSAYIWRNVVQTDKPVFQPCVWADFTGLDPFWFGFSYWQGWDMSSDRSDLFHRRFNESDYNVHAGVTAWEGEDGMSLEFELGHDWYTYHFDRREDGCSVSPSTREFYLNGKFKNPLVNVAAQASWMYDDIADYDGGFYYEVSLNREFALCDELALGLDWNVSMGDSDYLLFMYDEDVSEGFAGTTAKAYLTWSITEWMSLTGTIAYTGTLNSDARDAQSSDDKDILWGGLRLSFSY